MASRAFRQNYLVKLKNGGHEGQALTIFTNLDNCNHVSSLREIFCVYTSPVEVLHVFHLDANILITLRKEPAFRFGEFRSTGTDNFICFRYSLDVQTIVRLC